ncbi:MAG: hypothetical protein M3Y72_06540 [Acidobacteriota bacterium]|nr:hypothetical protein [Acidobacteriota bacterium]
MLVPAVTEKFAPAKAGKTADVLLTLPFIAFFLIQLAHHQLWGDETNAWALSAASPNLKTLFDYVHHEGHPALWYLLLWVPTRFTLDPQILKLIEAALGSGIYLMIGLWSPFSRLEKVLLFLNYFISFEYTVLARMYSVSVLVLLIYLYRRSKYPEQIIWNVALLGLLANTDVLGAILSGSLLVEYAWSEWQKTRWSFPRERAAQAFLIYLVLLSFSVWTGLPLKPVSVHSVDPIGTHRFELWHLSLAIRQTILVPWLPIRADFPSHFWNPVLTGRMIILAPFVIAAYYGVFKRQWNLWIVIGLTTVVAILFNHLIYMGRSRHFGITFLAFLVALWMQRYRRSSVPLPGRVLLSLGAAAGVLAAAAQWQHPFSNTSAAANWLRIHHLENSVLVSAYDSGTAPIAEQLQRRMYFLDCNCSNSFVLFSPERDSFTEKEIAPRLANAPDNLKVSSVLFITPFKLTSDVEEQVRNRGLTLSELAGFTRAEIDQENVYLYRATKTNTVAH